VGVSRSTDSTVIEKPLNSHRFVCVRAGQSYLMPFESLMACGEGAADRQDVEECKA
jgi:hypothetical protein